MDQHLVLTMYKALLEMVVIPCNKGLSTALSLALDPDNMKFMKKEMEDMANLTNKIVN